MHVMSFFARLSAALALFERNHLKRNAEYLGDLLNEAALLIEVIVTCSPQTTPDHLLAQQLRHEWSQSDDVRNCVAIPPFGEHADADDASDITTRWVKGA